MKIAYAKIDFSKLEAWYLINMCARRNQIGNLIYLVFKAFDRSRTLANVKNKKQNGPVFLYMCATCSEIPSNVSTMDRKVKLIYLVLCYPCNVLDQILTHIRNKNKIKLRSKECGAVPSLIISKISMICIIGIQSKEQSRLIDMFKAFD